MIVSRGREAPVPDVIRRADKLHPLWDDHVNRAFSAPVGFRVVKGNGTPGSMEIALQGWKILQGSGMTWSRKSNKPAEVNVSVPCRVFIVTARPVSGN
jgi:hypothetical protein